MRWGTRLSGGAGAFLCCAMLSVPLAAAAPVNDDFANRESLGAGLPVEVERSNFGATEEVGEPDLGGSGHSVWFAWEAAATGFVTVDTCQGGIGFRPEIAVFTGTALGALAEVAGSFATEGPDCTSGGWGTAVTFRALAGLVYAIGVDGVASFPGPEQGQGFIHLRLGATPRPANDDFADATPLSGQARPDGVYAAGATGFTWNATKEPGEPAHAGDSGGASVWYSWTAPTSDSYGLTACGRFGSPLLGVYTGDVVGGLTAVASDDHSCSFLSFSASQGATYRIAVDGKFDAGTGSAAMGSIAVNLFRQPPSPPATDRRYQEPVEPRSRGHKSIDTALRKRIVNSERRRATFFFRSNRKESRFRCKLDRRSPTWCKSPKTYEHLTPGPHVFQVTAIDPTSSGDGTPPVARFRILRTR